MSSRSADTQSSAFHSKFKVTVFNATTPRITLSFDTSSGGVVDGQGDFTIQATNSSGAVVNYTTAVVDPMHHSVPADVSCTPASGSVFVIGITPITCTATSNHRILIVEDAADVTVTALVPCLSAANSCGMTDSGVIENSACTAVIPAENLCAPKPVPGGGTVAGSLTPNSAAGLPGYKKPRQQIIYPDGHIVYLDEQKPSSTNTTSASGGSGISSDFQFAHPLKVGSGGTVIKPGSTALEVKNLQIFVIAKTGPGSPGHEVAYFGPATKNALAKFQTANAKDILAPQHLTKGTGVFGPTTITFVNSLIKKGK